MAKVFKDVPVIAPIKFPLVDETHTVDIQKGLEKLSAETLRQILMEGDEKVSDSMSVYRIIHGVDKHNEVVRDAFVRECREYKVLDERLRDARGYGLEGDSEPEIAIPAESLVNWLAENAPRVLQQVEKDGFAPPAPKAAAAAPGL